MPGGRAFVDLHCHTSASFDSLAAPAAVVEAAARRGITHLIVTDHDRIDGALRARDAAPAGLTVIVGEEIRTRDGDLIAAFLDSAIPPGLPATEAIAAIRAQGGLVGIPHPFDRFRGSLARGGASGAPGGHAVPALAGLATLSASVDWIETWNARVLIGDGNHRAAELALATGRPGVAVSDAHTTIEIGIASTILEGDPSTPDGLRAALAGPIELVMGRASRIVRLVTPVAKLIQRSRGNGRVRVAGR